LSRNRSWLFRLVLASVVLLILAALVAGAAALWLRRAMQAQLPQLDGDRHTLAVIAPVTVQRDHQGVPHIAAASLDDLIAAQAYVTAQDRLWQMDMMRRAAAGELAELLGSNFVEHDRAQRVLEFRQTAERITASLSPSDRRLFEDYALGVNAYINDADALPAEFRLLNYQPRRWQPVDSVLIVLSMVQTLDQQWPTKLSREAITRRIGPTLAAGLYPTGSWRDHPPTQALPDLSKPPVDVPPPPPDEDDQALRATAGDLARLRTTFGAPAPCRGCIPGSNEWVVSGAHTASGRPLLSNDMHLNHSVPGIWYEADLRAPGFHAAGVTLPGVPLVVAGHNDHIAWGFTAMYGDTQDLYVERTNAQGEYWDGNAWRPMERDHETIQVRFGQNQDFDVLRTAHGPVISSLMPHESRTIALRWTVYDPQFAGGIPIYELNTAANWQDFEAAMSHWWAPTLNTVYADDQGHIGYQAIGHIPQRPGGLVGVPITDGAHEWQGVIPFSTLPASLDPPGGILATANSRITPDGYPTPLSLEWASPYRNERIWKWLASHEKLTTPDMLRLQTDINSELDHELAQRFAYAIDHAHRPSSRLRAAADILRSWDGVMHTNEPAPAIVTAARDALWPLLLEPRLGNDWKLYEWPESAYAEEQLVTNMPPAWLPKQYASWDDLLAAAVARGLDQRHAPLSLKSWRYGDEHTIALPHPLYGMIPFFGWTGIRPHPQSGDTTTVKQVGRDFGPSQRFTMDWSNVDDSTENIVMGQSGDPVSPYYRDQWAAWYNATTFPLPFTPAAVNAATEHTLRLIP
ncbi:MAG TPA: penicillin acylase family protein, partial [Acidobacteriaceae bacterium]